MEYRNGLSSVLFFCLIGFFLISYIEAASHVCTYTTYYSQRYKTKCGFLNLGRCTRHRNKSKAASKCCSGWRSASGTSTLSCDRPICNNKIDPGACNVDYPNSYVFHANNIRQTKSDGTCASPGQCSCPKDGFFSAGHTCKICAKIDNCRLPTCTLATNTKCAKCDYYYGNGAGEQGYVLASNRLSCIKACSWRSDSTRCYPGSCASQYATNCQCFKGFSGHHCDTIDVKPDISETVFRLTASNGAYAESTGKEQLIYTNIISPASINVKVTSDYLPTVPGRQSYVKDFKVGVISESVKVVNVGKNKITNINCPSSNNRDNPNQALFTCEQPVPISQLQPPFIHNTNMIFTFYSNNGGFIKILNRETGITETKYYNGKQANKVFTVMFDTVDPFNSGQAMLSADDLTTKSTNQIRWTNWRDALSGVDKYEIEVFELHKVGNDLDIKKRVSTVTTTQLSTNVNLPNSAVFSIVLTTYDKAGNTKQARRIVIRDAGTSVTVTHGSALKITSALNDRPWQTSLSRVNIDWNNRFINLIHHNGRFLAAVKPYNGISSGYDDASGTRQTSAITNHQGIVSFSTVFKTDSNGGSTITDPTDNQYRDTGNLNQQAILQPTVRDGDTLKYFIRAYDIFQHYKPESVLVHFDSSAPVIKNLWLTKGDQLDVAVHGFEELNKMVIEWEAYDFHSGIETVKWKIFDKETEIEHGSQNIPPQGESGSLSECRSKYGSNARGANCYCTPGSQCYHRHFQVKPTLTNNPGQGILNNKNRGNHDHDYMIEITVVNVALLSTTIRKQITIDKSPPHEGVVHDGKYGSPEVDFQTDRQLSAHWEGFFDRESGVRFYQYAFGTSCFDAGKFALHGKDVTNTTSTKATWTASSNGQYYITVVAYNRAYEPSKPVCSDGVKIDNSVAKINNIYIEGGRVIGGLVREIEGSTVFYVTDARNRYQIDDADATCREKAVQIDRRELHKFPVVQFSNGTIQTVPADVYCLKDSMKQDSFSKIYLSKHSHLFVNWTVEESSSGIYDYKIGLASAKDSIAAPDLLPFTSTHHHTWYRGNHPQLSDGTEFFIGIKTKTKAGKDNVESLGPIIVHTSLPTYTGQVQLSFVDGKLKVDWSDGKIADSESLRLDISVAIGSQEGSQDVLPFTSITEAGYSCPNNPACILFTQKDLHWDLHHSFTYYASIRIKNIVGLYSVYSSLPYQHYTRLPAMGLVYEVVLEDEKQDFLISDLEDSDYQLSKTKLRVRWFGFESDDFSSDLLYKISVGSAPGLNDMSQVNVKGVNSHQFQGLTLQLHQTYYVTVTATSDAGSVTVTSNGVSIVTKDADLSAQIAVSDGPGCHHQDEERNWQPNHYSESPSACHNDVDYQQSMTSYSAWWRVDEDMKHLYPDIHWVLQVKQPDTDDIWNTVLEKDYILNSGYLLEAVELDYCRTYRSSIKFCSGAVCSQPVVSNGVSILNEPAEPKMTVTDRTVKDKTQLTVKLDYKSQNNKVCSIETSTDRYELSLMSHRHNSHLLTTWTKVDSVQKLAENQYQFTMNLKDKLDYSECRRLAVRIFNKAGLSRIVSADIKDCTAVDPMLIIPAIVIDAVGTPVSSDSNANSQGNKVQMVQNAKWVKPDAEYTPYNDIISAVWPTLRHGNYTWGLIPNNDLGTTTYFVQSKQIIKDPCTHPSVIVCGNTDKEFINIKPAKSLQHGQRYNVCIHADAKTIQHETWAETLSEINECSDGVTVDLTPPTAGRVWVNNLLDSKYQPSSNDLTVYWDGFIDLEENGGKVIHPSGISQYHIAIGSVTGGEDVLEKQNIGLVNHKIFHGLNLQSGHTYYITLQAFDFVNRSRTVYSEGFIVDNSQPELTSKPITFPSAYIHSTTTLSACWTGSFKDTQSGVSGYRWTIGSRPGHQDIRKFIQTVDDCGEAVIDPPLKDGATYYVTVEAKNGAGMTTTLTSRPVIVDSTPPTGGHVNDVKDSNSDVNSDDIDYITDSSKLAVQWRGFHDSHSPIKHFKIKLGTCADCDDVVPEFEAGNSQSYIFHHINLSPGQRYITTVTGCNMADMCTTESSDGVILDLTPPSPGIVMDGTKDRDVDYQAIRNYIGATWSGFTDSESDIVRYEWRVGTTSGGDEILKTEVLPVVERAYKSNLPNNKILPVGVKIFITLMAVNKAGLSSESTSNGFIIDTSLPVISQKPTLSSSFSSITTGTSVSRSSIKVTWSSEDLDSDIERQYISLAPHIMGDFDSAAMEIPSVVKEFTFPLMALHDGSKYNVKVITCNLAGLCQSSISDEILIDSSPPTAGTFGVYSEHAADLNRGNVEAINWEANAIYIAWLGFADLHTGVVQYIVSIGSQPFFTDLNKESKPVVLDHDVNGKDFKDEGKLQTFKIETKSLSVGDSVFIAVWAVNGVGLKSQPSHAEFKLGAGFLDLQRRCQPYDCNGHCVCAAENEKCSDAKSCNDITSGNGNNLLKIVDVTDLQGKFDQSVSYTSSNNYLSAGWIISNNQGKTPIRYEVSAGESNKATPTGIFDSAAERVWYDAGENTNVIIPFPRGKELEESISYSVFVRVWYDSSNYAIFKSPGVISLTAPPSVSYVAGVSVKELSSESSTKDLDFQTSTDKLIMGWKNNFRGGQHTLLYKPYISTHPQGHNIYKEVSTVSGTVHTANNLKLQEDYQYYSTVLGYNPAGLVGWDSSDGIIIDNTPPSAGLVHDGKGIQDIDYQSILDMVSASWYGFIDNDSGLISYFWCVSSVDDTKDCNVLPWTNVGLKTRVARNLTTPLSSGVKIYNKVYAVDGSGLKSPVVVSDGVVVNASPPQQVDAEFLGSNIIQNPSFESATTSTAACDSQTPTNWNTDSTSCVKAVQSHATVPKEGGTYIKLTGQIQQTVSVKVGSTYQVTIHVGYPHDVKSEHHAVEGFIQMGKEINTFKLNPDLCQGLCNLNNQPVILWYKYTYVYHPEQSSEDITIGTAKHNMILALDDIQLQEINYIPKGSNSNHIKHHAVFRPFWSSVHLNWHYKDSESPIVENKWAIGTVPGGTQIREFTSVGRRQHVTVTGLKLAHNTQLYLTVMATNKAGLTTVSNSNSIIVDITPPVVRHIHDGIGRDVKYQLSKTINVNWLMEDVESQIDYCEWAIGTSISSIDIKPFSRVESGRTTGSFTLTSDLTTSVQVYSTVRCFNRAGFPTTASTDGVLVIPQATQLESGQLTLLKDSHSQYPVLNNCHPKNNTLRLHWDLDHGGVDTRAIQVSVSGNGNIGKTISLQDLDYSSVGLQALKLQSATNYNVSVSSINVLGRQDNAVSQKFTTLDQPPTPNGGSSLKTARSFDGKSIDVSWEDLFVSAWDELFYEVSLGSSEGGADILQWQETTATRLSFAVANKNKTENLYLTLTAIDPCGTFTHLKHKITV